MWLKPWLGFGFGFGFGLADPNPNPNQARAIAAMWLKPGGTVLPAPAAVRADPVRYALG